MARAICLGVVPNAVTSPATAEKPFGGMAYDVIMWIDSDQIFEPDDFFRLLESPHDVTTGWYLGNDGGVLALPKSDDATIAAKLGDCRKWLTSEEVRNYDTAYMPLHTCGMGWFCLKRGVLERLQAPWFFYHPDLAKEDRFHSPLSGEDSVLCDKLRNIQVPIMLDTSVHVGHEKMHILRAF